MDNTLVPRSLFYKDKDDLYKFLGDPSTNSMENQFLKNLIKRPFLRRNDKAPEYILEIFNNAYYICTLIYFEDHPSIYLGRYLKIAANDYKDLFRANHMMPATMALVYNWLNTNWYKEQKIYFNNVIEPLDDFMIELYENFREWDIKGATEGKEDFYSLVMEKNKYKTNMEGNCPECRFIKDVVDDRNIHIQDIADGIEYILQTASDWREEELEYYVLTKALYKLEREKKDIKDLHQIEVAKDALRTQLKELGYWSFDIQPKQENITGNTSNDTYEIEKIRKECDEWKKKYEEALAKEPEKSYNSQTGMPCFTSRQMGILLTAVGRITEKNNPPGKTTIGEIVEKISGYKATSASSNMRGTMPEADINAVVTAIESKFPNLAAEVRKV